MHGQWTERSMLEMLTISFFPVITDKLLMGYRCVGG